MENTFSQLTQATRPVWSALTPIDGAILAILLLSALWAGYKGLAREICGITVLAISIAGTFFYHDFFVSRIQAYVPPDWLARLLSGLAVFAGFWIVFKIIAKYAAVLIRGALSAPLDCLAGAIFGLARGWMVLVGIFWAGQNLVGDNFTRFFDQSRFAPYLERSVDWARHLQHKEISIEKDAPELPKTAGVSDQEAKSSNPENPS